MTTKIFDAWHRVVPQGQAEGSGACSDQEPHEANVMAPDVGALLVGIRRAFLPTMMMDAWDDGRLVVGRRPSSWMKWDREANRG